MKLQRTIEITKKTGRKQSDIAQKLYSLTQISSSLTNTDKAFESMESFWEQLIPAASNDVKDAMKVIKAQFDKLLLELDPKNKKLIEGFEAKFQQYKNEHYIFKVRDKELKIATHYESLSHTQVPKVSTPKAPCLGRFAAMVVTRKCTWRVSIYSWNLSF